MSTGEQGGALRIATRGSDLALWQAGEVARRLSVPSVVNVVKTEGDRLRHIALQGQSTTGFFTRDVQRRLLDGEADLAVHSLKDLPTQLEPGLEIAAILPRAPVEDLLLVHPDWHDEEGLLPLREGCVVGAGSLRRQALVRLYAPLTTPQLIRGNVPTRVSKCLDGQYGAIVLARAGVERLGLDLAPLKVWALSVPSWLPAPGQGAVAVEVRADDARTRAAVAEIDDAETAAAVRLERQLLASFEGGCHTAFGAYASRVGDEWLVDVGIDRGELGWGQARFEGALEECAAVGPGHLRWFEPPAVRASRDLCRPWGPELASRPRAELAHASAPSAARAGS